MANFSKSFNFRNGVQVDDDKFIVKPTTGLVGIGSTVPTQLLDVAGNILASGSIQADGTTDATNVSSGSIIAKGGVGIAKKLFVGDATSIAGDVTANNILPQTNKY